jgi:hypothetical protein
MSIPDLQISEDAQEHVRDAIATWSGDNRDLALALQAAGHAMLLILDGRTDHIAMYEAAAKAVAEAREGPQYHG